MKTWYSYTSKLLFDNAPKFSGILEIPCNAVCATVNFNYKLSCLICVGKIDILFKRIKLEKN